MSSSNEKNSSNEKISDEQISTKLDENNDFNSNEIQKEKIPGEQSSRELDENNDSNFDQIQTEKENGENLADGRDSQIFTEESDGEQSETENFLNKSKTNEKLNKNSKKNPNEQDKNDPTLSRRSPFKSGENGKKQENSSKSSSQEKKIETKTTNQENSKLRRFLLFFVFVAVIFAIFHFYNPNETKTIEKSEKKVDWRDEIFSFSNLTDDQKFTISASLKEIFEKSKNREPTVSTLLIIGSNEERAAELARCILKLTNEVQEKDELKTELNFEIYRDNKLQLDFDLQSLLNRGKEIRSVAIRRIEIIPTIKSLDQLYLLFAYCDGENPKISDRLIVMTATADPPNLRQIRFQLENAFPENIDLIDPFYTRISGHTIELDENQQVKCE